MSDAVKVIIVGDIATGKTAFVKKCVYDVFSPHYKSTIGVDFASTQVDDVKVQFWDIAGQERFGNMLRVYFKEAKYAIICCDVTRESTINACEKWLIDILAKSENSIPIYIVGFKCDLLNDEDLEKVKTKVSLLYDKQVTKIVYLSNLNDSQQTLTNVVKSLLQETPVKYPEISEDDKPEEPVSLEKLLDNPLSNPVSLETGNLIDDILNLGKSKDSVKPFCKVENKSLFDIREKSSKDEQKTNPVPEEAKLHWLVSGTTKMDNELFKQMIMFGYITKANFEIFKNCFKRNAKLERESLTDAELDLVVTHYKTQNYGVVVSPDTKYLTLTW
jgi:small GTP-binding protein